MRCRAVPCCPSVRVLLVVFALVAAVRPSCLPAEEDAADFLERDLRAVGIAPTREAIAEYLAAILPTDARRRTIDEQIAALGSDDYETRRAATAALIRTPRLPRPLVEPLVTHPDPEVRRRAMIILRKADTTSHRSKVVAILRYVARERFDGLTEPLLAVMNEWREERYIEQLFVEAIAASAREADEPRLRVALEMGTRGQRLAAVAGLARSEPATLEAELRGLLGDRDEEIRLAAVTALLNTGHADVLPALAALLGSNELAVRMQASRALRYATGQRFGFAAYDKPEQRTRALATWRKWIASEGATVSLRLPVPSGRRVEIGRTLIACYTEKMLREIDDQGNTLWQAGGFTYLWGCHALPNAHRLGVDYREQYVVEFDSHGARVWLMKGLPGNPTDVERLENGNTLICLAEPGLLMEVSPEKEVVWERRLDGRPTTARRLESGRTLVCLQFQNRVVEIDETGEIAWELGNLVRPHTAQRLDNGNTLVCEMDPKGRVVEFDLDGNLVWEKAGIDNPAQAQRLANGNTLISSDNGLEVYDGEGHRVRQVQVSRSRFFAF